MRSSTSSSERIGSRTRPIVWFAAAFVPLFAATVVLWRALAPGNLATPVTDHLLRDPDYYVAMWNSIQFDHFVLWKGARGTARPMAAADVLFLGNSRMMFGLDRTLLRRFFGSRGLRHYLLGFGHAEGDAWAELLYQKHHLHPKLVVVNADEFFERISPFAEHVLAMSPFDREKEEFQATATMEVSRRLNKVLPHLSERDFGMSRKTVILRSIRDGAWVLPADCEPHEHEPFIAWYNPLERVSPSQMEHALRFKQMIERGGARLVLMHVLHPPYGGPASPSGRSAEIFAHTLGVPLVAPNLERPETWDGSHLTRDSAERFTALFLRELAPLLPAAETAASPIPATKPLHGPPPSSTFHNY